MDVITIILFFVYTYGLGYSVTFFLKNSEDPLERYVMRIGIGLCAFILLGVIINFIGVQVDWKIFLAASIILPIYNLIKNKTLNLPKIKLTFSTLFFIFAFIFFSITLFMYLKGSFAYPYYEDDDPWGHAASALYISETKTLYEPYPDKELFHYLDPYPPGYDVVFGILKQTSPSLSWTIKFFNSLIISLGILFFYFFSKRFFQNTYKGFFATFILFAVPCYLSHFIWAHAFIPSLIIIAFYCIENIKQDSKKWFIPAAIAVSSIFLTQPTKAVKFTGMFAIYIAVYFFMERKTFLLKFGAFFCGVLVSLIWWAKIIFKYGGFKNTMIAMGIINASTGAVVSKSKSLFRALGTASREYTFNDFFVAKSQNMINNPIGLGVVITIILLFTSIFILISMKKYYLKNKIAIIISLGWLIYTFLGVSAVRFPIALFPFRFWKLLAIAAALVTAEGIMLILGLFSQKKVKVIIAIIIMLLIVKTSFIPKYQVNTAIWGSGGGVFRTQDELNGYVWLKTNLPINTRVYPLTNMGRADIMYGMDKYTCYWCENDIKVRKDIFEQNKTIEPAELHNFLKENNYEFTLIDLDLIMKFQNKTNDIINGMVSSGYFRPEFQNQNFLALRVI